MKMASATMFWGTGRMGTGSCSTHMNLQEAIEMAQMEAENAAKEIGHGATCSVEGNDFVVKLGDVVIVRAVCEEFEGTLSN